MEHDDAFDVFCDVLALVYHESRNIRHLVSKGLADREKWRFLVSLPTNRDDAWRKIAPLRDEAKQSRSVTVALRLFEKRFHVSLSDLAMMLGDKNWRHAKMFGGNAWEQIARLTINLAEAMEQQQHQKVESLVLQLQNSQHNTGTVREKLARLEIPLTARSNHYLT